MKTYVVFHAGCTDGLSAAAVALKALPVDTEAVEGSYHKPLPDFKDSTIYLVDFSFRREDMLRYLAQGNTIYLLDHHISAIKSLIDIEHPNLHFHVSHDNTKSGVGLAWEYFFPDQRMPLPLKYIQDRDLWEWKFSQSKPFLAWLDLQPKTIQHYVKFLNDVLYNYGQKDMVNILEQGRIVLAYQDTLHKNALKQVYYLDMFDYTNIPVINCPGYLSSDVGNIIMTKHPNTPFVLMWFMGPTGVHFSLRSTGSGVDVSVVAKLIHPSGGGHVAAAGVVVPQESLNTELMRRILKVDHE